MKLFVAVFAFLLAGTFISGCANGDSKPVDAQSVSAPGPGAIYDLEVETIDGKKIKLADYKGKTLVIVNVASECGYTGQYADLQSFYEKYKGKGVEVLGFPANDFMGQEPGTNEEIQKFCTSKFGVTFPMFAKIGVKGDDMHPLYKLLTQTTGEKVTWNFNKFVVDKTGKIVKRFDSKVKPGDDQFLKVVDSIL